MDKILEYLDKRIVEYELREQDFSCYYYDGRLDAYRELYNIIAGMAEAKQ